MKPLNRSMPSATACVLAALLVGVPVAAAVSVRTISDELTRLKADAELAPIAKESIQRAETALARAQTLSSQQPKPVTEQELALEAAAEWTGVAKDLRRAQQTEKNATELEQQQRETKTNVARTRALLEQLVARRARLEVQVQQLETGEASSTPEDAQGAQP